MYLRTLKRRGQLVSLGAGGGGGGRALISYPESPLYLPNVLKYRAYGEWLDRERIWGNM